MQTFSLCYYSNFLEDLIDNATYNKNKINGFIFMKDYRTYDFFYLLTSDIFSGHVKGLNFMIASRTSVIFSLLINDIFSRPVKAV